MSEVFDEMAVIVRAAVPATAMVSPTWKKVVNCVLVPLTVVEPVTIETEPVPAVDCATINRLAGVVVPIARLAPITPLPEILKLLLACCEIVFS